MTNRVTPGSSLLETMRALAQGKTHPTQSPSPAPSTPHAAGTRSIGQLRQRLTWVLANVDPNDRAATDQIRETALREIILWEFGSDFRQSAHFQPMIDRISEAMTLDERFHAQFVEMIQGLKR